jgi:phosphoribosylpyrophosphate synthetase
MRPAREQLDVFISNLFCKNGTDKIMYQVIIISAAPSTRQANGGWPARIIT